MTTTVASCTIRDADVDEAEFLDLVASQAALPVPDDRAAAVLRVAVRHGQVAGFASVTVDGDGGPRLDYVFVHHHVRRQGIGRALLDDARRARPTQAIRVEVHPAAETSFRRIGAQREGNIAPDDRNPHCRPLFSLR